MQHIYKKTLDTLTKLYLESEQFNGVRGDRLALEMETDQTMARYVLRDLCMEGLVDIVSSRAFANPYIKADRSIPKDLQLADAEEELNCICIYPSAKHLANAVKKKRYPHYKPDIRYFNEAVLDHYRAHPDKYLLSEQPFGMGPRAGAYAGLPKRQWHKAWGSVKCAGVRELSNGKRAICVLLRYLAQMPKDEQEHWQQFEIPAHKQDFLPDSADEEFTKWYYGGVRAKPAWQSADDGDED